jgi:putative ABC transport system permease protein
MVTRSILLVGYSTRLCSFSTAAPNRSRGRYTALKPLQRSALRSGMIPIINQMSAAGVITLPGMMTGQILAGMDPLEAAKYQILLLFLLGGGAGLGALATVYIATWRITDERDRLRLDRLAQR